jgi:hypothetical protein
MTKFGFSQIINLEKMLINPRRDVVKEFTLAGPQQRQKCTSREEPGCTTTGVLSGKNIENLNNKENIINRNAFRKELSHNSPQVHLQHIMPMLYTKYKIYIYIFFCYY